MQWEVARVQDVRNDVPDHEEIEPQKETKNAPTVRHQGQKGEGQLFFLQENCLAAEDESQLGESSIWC